MNSYLLIESQDHFESLRVNEFYQMAIQLKENNNEVVLFILQNGVFSFRKSVRNNNLINSLIKKDIPIFIDEFSIRERGIPKQNITDGIIISSLEVILELLIKKCKVIWHS